MVIGARVRHWSLLTLLALVLAGVLAFQVADSADADMVRCEQHRADSRERAGIVTGSGPDVLVIGDSWTVGLGHDDLGASWPRHLSGRVHVAGFSGSGFSAQASHCRRVSFHDRATSALATRPDLVVVAGGLNDFDQPSAAIRRGFADLIHALAGHHVVVVGPAAAPARAEAVPRVDALLAELSRSYDIAYVGTSDLELDYLDDGLHLTAEGHDEFGETVARRIATLTPSRLP